MADAIGDISGGSATLIDKTITANGTYNASDDSADGYEKAVVNVPNSYTQSDEGKVVSNGALVSQTSQSITQNGTYDTTIKNQAVVSVPNSYSASDEGKVVSNGALVAQTSDTVTQNGTVDTTLINSLAVNVSGTDRVPIFGNFTMSNSTVLSEWIANKGNTIPLYCKGSQITLTATYASVGEIILDFKGTYLQTASSSMSTSSSAGAIAKITCEESPDFYINLSNPNQTLRGTSRLTEIHPALMHASSNAFNRMWDNNGGKELTYVRMVPNVAIANYNFTYSPKLDDDSIVSIANAIKDGSSGTLTLHATPKARCDSLMGTVSQVTVDEDTYNLFTKNSNGTVSLTNFITTTKGWTLA